MKLFFAPNSPYARKCRILILEKGIAGVEQREVNTAENAPELLAVNPLGTVPAFVTQQGLHLCDSTVICEYLDSLPSDKPRLIPEGEGRLCVMALAVLADGIMDAAVACVMEGRRPAENRYPAWVSRKEAAILRAIEKIAKVGLDASLPLTLGAVNTAVALAYVSFRLPHLSWKDKFPELNQWLELIDARESFVATRPS